MHLLSLFTWIIINYILSAEELMLLNLWCWRRLLRVPWAGRRSNQSILKEISPEYSLEGLMLKHQYLGHLIPRTDSLEDPDAGKDWRQEEKGTKEDEILYGITDVMNMSLSRLWDFVMDSEAWHTAVHGFAKYWTRLSNWTEFFFFFFNYSFDFYVCGWSVHIFYIFLVQFYKVTFL